MHLDPFQLSNLQWTDEPHWTDEPIVASFRATVNSPSQEISFWIEGKEDMALKMVFGCFMITLMPEEALNETLRSMKDILEFYIETPRKALPQRPSALPASGRAVSSQKRPDLIIAE